MMYNLIHNNIPTDKLRDFDTPPDLSHKNMAWLTFVDNRNPPYNPDTEKLGPIEKIVEVGRVVWSRSIIPLSPAESVARIIQKRRMGYRVGTMAVKGVDGDEVAGLGFWIDAIAGQLESMGVALTPEMQTLMVGS